MIRIATYVTDQALEAIKETLVDGKPNSERGLAIAADIRMLNCGAERTKCDSMIKSGPRTAFHGVRTTNCVVQSADPVMTDIDARYRR